MVLNISLFNMYKSKDCAKISFSILPQIREKQSGKCLDALGTKSPGGMRTCHGLGGHQVWSHCKNHKFRFLFFEFWNLQTIIYSGLNELRSAHKCLEPKSNGSSINLLNELRFESCDSTAKQKWIHSTETGQFVNAATKMCLTHVPSATQGEPVISNSSTEPSFLMFLATVAQESATKAKREVKLTSM